MKTATVRDLRNHFARVAVWVENGESVTITRGGKVFATLVPDRSVDRPEWPNLAGRRRRIFPKGPKGKAPSELVNEGRGDR